MASETPIKPWRAKFHSLGELANGDVRQLIRGIMPEGISCLASHAGVGKTWIALSEAHALTTGEPFLGQFEVPEVVPAIYLVPEMGERAFRQRCEKMRIPDNPDLFLCQTVRDGILKLSDPELKAAVRDLHPVVFLDSLIRFEQGEENSARDSSQGIAQRIFDLLGFGAQGVTFLHHAPKNSGKPVIDMTLENMLRGTGDFGAMCDAAWGLQHKWRKNGRNHDYRYLEESRSLTRLSMKCLKPRDFDPAEPMVIQGRPTIDKQGDLEIIEYGEDKKPASAFSTEKRLAVAVSLVCSDPKASKREISRRTGWNTGDLTKNLASVGWEFTESQGWQPKQAAPAQADSDGIGGFFASAWRREVKPGDAKAWEAGL